MSKHRSTHSMGFLLMILAVLVYYGFTEQFEPTLVSLVALIGMAVVERLDHIRENTTGDRKT